MGWIPRSRRGSKPQGFKPIVLSPDYPQHFYQVAQNWTWGNAPAHEQQLALTNCWNGNQLPGAVNFIPQVPLSHFTWNVPVAYMNQPRTALQYNAGYNLSGMTSVQSASLVQRIQQAWQARGL